MSNGLLESAYNPDVLSCLANLSNDEVFTSPDVVNEMLDMLPQDLFKNPDTTFLEPACKTGVFLREIAKRLIDGLEPQFPNLNDRLNHILKKQLYGISVTELTSLLSRRSLYCSKWPNGEYSIIKFDTPEGNIKYRRIEHAWKNGNCAYCGASEKEYKRGSDLETYAYQFIHTNKPEEIFNMKFDVIIGNPPYQLSTGGGGEQSRQAKPIYNIFIEQAMKMKPRYLSMIIPSRWFSGGMGLDSFREKMLNDKSMRYLVDYPNSSEVFYGVDIAGGICYFLWDRDYNGECQVSNIEGGKETKDIRPLNEFPTFVRYSRAIPIIRKVLRQENGKKLSETIYPQGLFGLKTNYEPKEKGIPCWFIQKIGRKFADKDDVIDTYNILNKWKFLIPKSPIAGQTDFTKPVGFYYDGNTRVAKPGECCTQSWIVAGAFDTEEETLNFKSYLFTKTVRFLLLQQVVSQDVSRNKFCFVPALEKYDKRYTDEILRKKWNITEEEWIYIDSRIHNYGDNRGDYDEQ